MKFAKTSIFAALAITAATIAATSAGCELIASVDPSLADGTGGAGGSAVTASGTGGTTTGMGGMTTSTASTGGGGNGGGGTTCMKPADCAAPKDACKVATCVNMVCGETAVADGMPATTQVAGDCQKIVCNADVQTKVNDDTDVPNDNETCTTDTCANGKQVETPIADGMACAEAPGTVCQAGKCVACIKDGDCMNSMVCQTNMCVVGTCKNGKLDPGETDKDCGGPCSPCADGKNCLVPGDCVDGVCSGSPLTCAAPTCTDSVKNGNEGDVDCGGSCPNKCAFNKGCGGDGDCKGGSCVSMLCAATCTDGQQDGTETDSDCGSTCPKCPDGEKCAGDGDCTGGVCLPANKCCTPLTKAAACGATKCGMLSDGCGGMIDCALTNCTDQGIASCGNNGMCTAGNVCAKYTVGTVCAAAKCVAGAPAMQTTAGVCDGMGNPCVAGTQSSCGTYNCNAGLTACLSSCPSNNAAGDASCDSAWCNGTVCTAPQATGGACDRDSQCSATCCLVAGTPAACTAGNLGMCL